MNNLINSLLLLLTALVLVLVGFYSSFKTNEVIDFYASKDHTNLFKQIIQRRWVYVNVKIVGVFILTFGVILLIYAIATLYNLVSPDL